MNTSIAIIYHSGYGHTERVAQAVAEGARGAGATITLIHTDALDEQGWAQLDAADAIIFGAPTYMAGVSAPFKLFMDATSKRWTAQAWKDKLAAGFTNAGMAGGDNLNALYQIIMFALQHSMIWVGAGIMPLRQGDMHINRLGAFAGLITQSADKSPEVTPPADDLLTARMFGERVAAATARFARGR